MGLIAGVGDFGIDELKNIAVASKNTAVSKAAEALTSAQLATQKAAAAVTSAEMAQSIANSIGNKLQIVQSENELKSYLSSNFALYSEYIWHKKAGDLQSNGVNIIRVDSNYFWEKVSSKAQFIDQSLNQIIGGDTTGINTTTVRTIFFGIGAGRESIGGSDNLYIGSGAGQYAKNVSSVVFIGQYAGTDSRNASYSNHIGYSSGYDEIGLEPYFGGNDSFGLYTNEKRIGSRNLSLGRGAGNGKFGNDNISIGPDANSYFVDGNTVTTSFSATTKRITAAGISASLGLSITNEYGIIKIIHPTIIGAISDFPHQIKRVDINTIEIVKDHLTYVPGSYNSITIKSEKRIDRSIAIGVSAVCLQSDEVNLFDTIFRSPNGNVGIGVRNPTHKLEIAGNLSVQGLTIGLGASAVPTNTVFGEFAFISNISGSQNVVFGRNSGYSNISGSLNAFFGSNAGYLNKTASYNVAFGFNALINNESGSQNTVAGSNSAPNLNGGTNNVIVGYNTAAGLITGNNNTILGANVSGLSGTVSNTVILADGAGNIRFFADSNGNIGINTLTPNESAILELQSTNKGFLLPRLSNTQILAISSPSEGLEVYNTTLKKKCFFNGTAWQQLTSIAM